jgi:hypothetical protein
LWKRYEDLRRFNLAEIYADGRRDLEEKEAVHAKDGLAAGGLESGDISVQ